jgi:hypothetical protein
MSCIPKILSLKGDKEFIVDGEIAIEGGGNYKGYDFLITFVSYGHRCGYVAVPSNHAICNKKYEHRYPDLNVHGGITYFDKSRFEELIDSPVCDDKWIGFDAGHYYDLQDIEQSEKYFGEIEWVKFRKNNPMPIDEKIAKHRSYKYMVKNCKNLIDQLIERSIC